MASFFPAPPASPPRLAARAVVPVRRTRLLALAEMRWASASVALFLVGLLAQLCAGPSWLWWTVYLGCSVAGGWEPGLAGLKALRAKTLDVDLLMVVGVRGGSGQD
ncbi:MAG: hypothetical protein H0V92_01210 [Pseudonocardiales bacterium]|nr:hypothetical protein [Pseudonocardiales bacterium]